MRVLVFLHGTAIMHASAVGRPRAERVRQSSQREPPVTDFASYVPTEAAVAKVRAWQRGGADLCYLSSRRGAAEARADRGVLDRYGFPAGPVFFREPGESYADVARRAGADVVVEDDCESIGGRSEMAAPGLGGAIRCIVVPEFGGLAHLPDDPGELAAT